MASTVKRFTKPVRAYDWDKWADGRLWRLIQGKDFSIPIRSMRALVYQRARRLNVKATTSVPDSKTLEFRFEKRKAVKA